MNIIEERQNEDHALLLQAAARRSLDRADNFDLAYWLIIIFFAVIGIVYPQNKSVILLQAIWFCLSFFLDGAIKKYTSQGAKFKESFDNYVFGWKEKISENDIIESKEVLSTNYKFESSKDKLILSVKNWYENVDGKKSMDAIVKAMEENGFYDKKINRPLKFVLIFIVLSFFIMCYQRNLPMDEIVSLLFVTFANPFKKFVTTCQNLHKVTIMNDNISKLLNNVHDVDSLKDIQSIFYRKRLISGVSSRYIYSIKHNAISKQSNEIYR